MTAAVIFKAKSIHEAGGSVELFRIEGGFAIDIDGGESLHEALDEAISDDDARRLARFILAQLGEG